MDATIEWTRKAIRERRKILLYWTRMNGSDSYSQKLNKKFLEATLLMVREEFGGRTTQLEGVLMHKVDHYCLFYRKTLSGIIVLDFWDERRNPEDHPLK